MKYRIRDMDTLKWVCYGETDEPLETSDEVTAIGWVGELSDYCIRGQVVEVPE